MVNAVSRINLPLKGHGGTALPSNSIGSHLVAFRYGTTLRSFFQSSSSAAAAENVHLCQWATANGWAFGGIAVAVVTAVLLVLSQLRANDNGNGNGKPLPECHCRMSISII